MSILDRFSPVFRPINAADVWEMTRWCYEAPYDVYNLGHPPNDADIAYWLDPVHCAHVMCDDAGKMIGFCTFGPDGQVPGGDYSADALDIGMGLRPDHTGRGLGVFFAEAAMDYAQETYAAAAFRVTIASFNQRAQRVWQRCGFQPVETFSATRSETEFVILART